ncbi:hypothetical protein M8J75_003046 [Diaphorina citri]|nr:hypothetical protein M8J75_003046 [Diaphorina citri]
MMSSASMTSYLHHCTVLACGLFCLGLFDTTQAQRPAFGKCPHLKTVDNFDVQKFEGQWFEVERSFYVLELAAACTSFNFTVKNDGSFKVLIKTKNRITGSINKNNGIATPSSSNAGLLQYRVDSRLPVVMARMLPTSGLYYVLHTDYDHYAILWSCSNLGLFHAGKLLDWTGLQYRVDSRLPVVMARMLPTSGLYYVLHTDYDHYAILWSCSNLGLFHAGKLLDWAGLQYRVDSRLPVVMARMLPTSGLYYVLHTDYDHYAILWSCSNLGLFHADQIWVLGRERDLEVGDRTFVYQTLQDLGLDEGRLVLTKHANCPAES